MAVATTGDENGREVHLEISNLIDPRPSQQIGTRAILAGKNRQKVGANFRHSLQIQRYRPECFRRNNTAVTTTGDETMRSSGYAGGRRERDTRRKSLWSLSSMNRFN